MGCLRITPSRVAHADRLISATTQREAATKKTAPKRLTRASVFVLGLKICDIRDLWLATLSRKIYPTAATHRKPAASQRKPQGAGKDTGVVRRVKGPAISDRGTLLGVGAGGVSDKETVSPYEVLIVVGSKEGSYGVDATAAVGPLDPISAEAADPDNG